MQILLDLKAVPFNLDYTLNCGQVFRWEKKGNYWYGIIGETIIKLRQDRDKIFFYTYPKEMDIDCIRRYLRLDDNLPEIISDIDKDITIKRAINSLYGLRITRQDPWECLISYICATFSNISRIKGMIQNLSRKFGQEISYDGFIFYLFPSEKSLANAKLSDLNDCGLGYRAKYVKKTSMVIKNLELNLEDLKRLTYGEAKNLLLKLPGIGPKAADCILLFSLDKIEAFPVDVWIRRTLLRHYSQYFQDCKLVTNKGFTKTCYEQISAFGRSYFGKYAGYAQEYLYHYYRFHNIQSKEILLQIQNP